VAFSRVLAHVVSGALPHLRVLVIHNCGAELPEEKEMGRNQTHTFFSLYQTLAPMKVLPLPALTSIDIGASMINANSMGELVKRLPNLEHLGVANSSKINGSCLASLATYCPHITSLDLRDCKAINGFHLSRSLSQLPSLRVLDLSGVPQVGDRVVETIATCKALHVVRLASCNAVTSKAFAHLALLPHIKELDLSCCNLLGDEGLEALVRSHGVNRKLWKQHQFQDPEAKSVHSNMEEKPDEGEHVQWQGSNLHTLLLRECRLLSASTLSRLSTITSLTKLDIGECVRATDSTVLKLCQYLVAMKELSLNGLSISNETVVFVVEHCPSLHFINLRECLDLTYSLKPWLTSCFPHIHVVWPINIMRIKLLPRSSSSAFPGLTPTRSLRKTFVDAKLPGLVREATSGTGTVSDKLKSRVAILEQAFKKANPY